MSEKFSDSNHKQVRSIHTRVKTARGRKLSSTRWLERQLNDPYVQKAVVDGYRSRSAYKLLEIDKRYNILFKGAQVIDLGAAPGGWCQVAAEKTASNYKNVNVVGIDYLSIESIPGVKLLQKDFLHEKSQCELIAALNGCSADIILSDMAAPTTGHRKTDHLRTMYLCEAAADFAIKVLKPGGHFLAKTFLGGTQNDILTILKQRFSKIYHVKPPSSRKGSVELYLLAKNFKNVT